MLRLILALLVPWLNFFTIGKPIQGVICLILQLTLIGWIPAHALVCIKGKVRAA
jgi:hypothetical protein